MTDRGYKAITNFAKKYHGKGFNVLAFPCNQFGKQEPGTEAEIKEFVKKNYGIPDGLIMFSKVKVNGSDTHPVFLHLKKDFPGDVPWNFMGHWLVGKDGKVLKRYGRLTSYGSVESDINNNL
mmetsp:Transcript_11297/g.16889  ORF Transcript_11297/g.16889 Transcript_11297/m.16889 type:complete len:122 (+) Transcript_11297:237-602(+)|eukprot:CAMPEP_0167741132 /NCGR_PEP_ID=MMETSP0110_2-20121227/686_1 /TAXON_ID=629695 /ORGANISM="Gymnochlora sp., Strain CCMP2014" /LENGTH=121 /DNA_ID=CAMNT_0007625149 /DNA_START=257 /DNA_END=622 /DNA_ORIENTATION=+